MATSILIWLCFYIRHWISLVVILLLKKSYWIDPKDIMKFPGPLENQRLSFLLEKAISREAQMWKVNVPKMPTNQVMSSLFTVDRWLLLELSVLLSYVIASWHCIGEICTIKYMLYSLLEKHLLVSFWNKTKMNCFCLFCFIWVTPLGS